MIDAMSRLRRVLWAAIFTMLRVFGAIADHALLEQARLAKEAALAEADEKARLTVVSVRAGLAQVEQDVLAGKKLFDVTVGRVANPFALTGPVLRYGERTTDELEVLISSEALTSSTLPEAVVAAIALGRADVKARVAEHLLSGQLPVLADDLPELARVLGVESDPRVRSLQDNLRRVPRASASNEEDTLCGKDDKLPSIPKGE